MKMTAKFYLYNSATFLNKWHCYSSTEKSIVSLDSRNEFKRNVSAVIRWNLKNLLLFFCVCVSIVKIYSKITGKVISTYMCKQINYLIIWTWVKEEHNYYEIPLTSSNYPQARHNHKITPAGGILLIETLLSIFFENLNDNRNCELTSLTRKRISNLDALREPRTVWSINAIEKCKFITAFAQLDIILDGKSALDVFP